MHVLKLLETSTKEELDNKYETAAKYILEAREAMLGNKLQEEQVNQNERFFTGAFCDGLNAVLDKGISVLHQGCIGHGSTHSDFSARNILGSRSTLMVGEAKANDTMAIRTETRGQVFNELIRHRKIDEQLGFPMCSRPVLLLVLNFHYVNLDLVFPSKKGNSMEKRGWLTFDEDPAQGMETFWTTQIASVSIAGAEGKKKLPKVLRFIVDTLRYLENLDANLPRAQFKTPFLIEPEEEVQDAEKRGDNVTIIETKSGKRVYKEFCYYLREEDGFNILAYDSVVEQEDQRKPPARDLRGELGEPYCNWKVEDGPFQIKILSYDMIEGDSWPTSRQAWSQVLAQVQTMHRLGYVHGDLLPRNLIFSGEVGHVIDFDLTRKENERFVRRYNHEDFASYRHTDARAGLPMKKEHDVWALSAMTREFFGFDVSLSEYTIEVLIQVFAQCTCGPKSPPEDGVVGDATVGNDPSLLYNFHRRKRSDE